ncbi:MAG: hypothetical protein AB8W78_12415 [Arsenophonus endosymbiont of Dermacentor nuttalli]
MLSDYKIDKMAFMHLITQLNKLKGGDVEIVVIFIMCSFVQYYVIIQWETGHVFGWMLVKIKISLPLCY